MMGLAAYGEPRFAPQVREIVRTEADSTSASISITSPITARASR